MFSHFVYIGISYWHADLFVIRRRWTLSNFVYVCNTFDILYTIREYFSTLICRSIEYMGQYYLLLLLSSSIMYHVLLVLLIGRIHHVHANRISTSESLMRKYWLDHWCSCVCFVTYVKKRLNWIWNYDKRIWSITLVFFISIDQ